MGDHEGRPGAVNLGQFVGADLSPTDRPTDRPTVYIAATVGRIMNQNLIRTLMVVIDSIGGNIKLN